MIVKHGDCIPVRINPNDRAVYYGRIVGFNVLTGNLVVVSRDSGGEKKEVKFKIDLDSKTSYVQQ